MLGRSSDPLETPEKRGRPESRPQPGLAAPPFDRLGVMRVFALAFAALLLEAQTVPAGLTRPGWPKHNPYSAAKAELGRTLFFDTRLSASGKFSCATCHQPERAFADAKAVSTGAAGAAEGRNAPSLINVAYARHLFWDGRSDSIEQATQEMLTLKPMDNRIEELEARLAKVEGYGPLFKDAFGDTMPSIDRITEALATFQRTLLSGNSPYDRYMSGEKTALTEQQAAGKDLFSGKARCTLCHRGPTLSSGEFLNVGAGQANPPDEGRFRITRNAGDWRVFKVPGLREVALTAPYFHDGSAASLEEVIDFYDRGGEIADNKDVRLRPLNLSAVEKKALAEFLKALSGEGWQHAKTAPQSLPK